jgi:ankyrin repeat protein
MSEEGIAEAAPVAAEKTIHELAALGDVEGVCKRLASGEGGVNQTDEYGNTLLHVAAARGLLVLTRELVRTHKADLSFRNLASLTPVLVAAKFGQTSELHLLVELGGDLQDKDALDRTCLHYASQFGRANSASFPFFFSLSDIREQRCAICTTRGLT